MPLSLWAERWSQLGFLAQGTMAVYASLKTITSSIGRPMTGGLNVHMPPLPLPGEVPRFNHMEKTVPYKAAYWAEEKQNTCRGAKRRPSAACNGCKFFHGRGTGGAHLAPREEGGVAKSASPLQAGLPRPKLRLKILEQTHLHTGRERERITL